MSDQPRPRKILLTIPEVSAEYGLNDRMLRRLVDQRKIEFSRPTGPKGKIFIKREAVEKLIAKTTYPAFGEARRRS